jgi:thioester reductase-like protein
LVEILQQTPYIIYCLIHAQDEKTAWLRIEQLWKDSELEIIPDWRTRIKIGDLSKPKFGLDSLYFKELSGLV